MKLLQERLNDCLRLKGAKSDEYTTFLNSLFRSSYHVNEIVDALATVDSEGKHLAFYLLAQPSTGNTCSFWISSSKKSPMTIYFTLLNHLLDKGADPQKITTLLGIKEFHYGHTIGHGLVRNWAMVENFLDVVARLPSENRVQLFLVADAKEDNIVNNLICNGAPEAQKYKRICLDLLKKDLTSTESLQLAQQIISIFDRFSLSKERIAAILTNTQYHSLDTSLLFLNILNTIVSKYPSLIPTVLNVLLPPTPAKDKSEQLAHESACGNIVRSTEHISLLLIMLNKILEQGHFDSLARLLANFNTIIKKETSISDHAIFQFLNHQDNTNTISLIQFIQALIQKTGFKKLITSFPVSDIARDSLDIFLEELFENSKSRDKSVKNACVKLCETILIVGTEAEKLEVQKKALTDKNPLNTFFITYNPDFLIEIKQRIVKNSLEKKILGILGKEQNNEGPINQFLASLFTSSFDANEIIDSLSIVDAKGKHLGFYLTSNASISNYFKLLDHLLARGGCTQKITRLLSIPETETGKTFGHWLIENDQAVASFCNLIIHKLPVNYRIHLLSQTCKKDNTLLMSLTLSLTLRNSKLGTNTRALESLCDDLYAKDDTIARKIVNLLAKRNQQGNLGLQLAACSDLSHYLLLIDKLVTDFPNLIPEIYDLLLDKNNVNKTTLLQEIRGNTEIREFFLNILTKIPSDICPEKLSTLLEQFNSPVAESPAITAFFEHSSVKRTLDDTTDGILQIAIVAEEEGEVCRI